MKAKKWLKNKGIHIDYADTFLLVPVSGDTEYSLFELMELYGDEREAEGIERGKIIGEHGCESYIE